MLIDVIEMLFRLPLWQDFWGDIENRRSVKQNFILNYRISYIEEPLPERFAYNCKIDRRWKLSEAILAAKIYYLSKPAALSRGHGAKKEL